MMTSKERAEFRAQANTLDVTLIVGKGGISDTLLDEAVVLLDSHELVKGRVLETSGLTAREASDAICEALGAEVAYDQASRTATITADGKTNLTKGVVNDVR